MGLLMVMWLSSWSSGAQSASSTNALPARPPSELLLKEVHYAGKLTDTEARFGIEIAGELLGRGEATVTLFDGDLAVPAPKLPPGLRLAREGRLYLLTATKSGPFKCKVDLVAKITRAEPWNQVSFVGPAAGIATVTAEATAADAELQLLSGAPTSGESGARSRVQGVLGADRTVALRWQAKQADVSRKSLVTAETAVTAQVNPTVIRFQCQFQFEVLQGKLARLLVALPTNHTLTRVEGENLRDWQVRAEAERQVLSLEFLKPVEKTYALGLQTEQTLETMPHRGPLSLPQPLELERETGSLTLKAEDTVIETEALQGLRQVTAPEGAQAAYQFYGRPLGLALQLRRIEPVLKLAGRVTARLEETRLLVNHNLNVTVEKAGVYKLELGPLAGFAVTDVRGEGLEDWKVLEGRLAVTFSSRLLGSRRLGVQLEQPHKTLPEEITVTPLRLTGAAQESGQVGAASAPGLRLKTTELVGLREIPVTSLRERSDELLAFVADQGGWSCKLGVQRLSARIVAEVFNLVTIGDGLVGGSATVRYVLANQGVQEFKIRVPAHWKNVEFTGPNIRRKDQQGEVWTLSLQDKAWGAYTLVVTYDEQFDPHQASLSLGGLHALGVERETGHLAVTAAANVQLREKGVTGPLRRVDENDLADTDRTLITRSVLLTYRQTSADPYQLTIDVSRFEEAPVLNAVADRTQLTTVLTESGQMLTEGSYMVKNNDKAFQRFTLPKGAEFWSCSVDGQPAKAERQGEDLLVPLPRQQNRDRAFPVEIVYAQKTGELKGKWRQPLDLEAPRTDLQTTYAEWELFVPATHDLAHFGGSLSVARGTTYGLRDAWRQFVEAYGRLLRGPEFLVVAGVSVLLLALFLAALRHGRHGVIVLGGVLVTLVVLAGIAIPNFVKAKSRAIQIAAIPAPMAAAPSEEPRERSDAQPQPPPPAALVPPPVAPAAQPQAAAAEDRALAANVAGEEGRPEAEVNRRMAMRYGLGAQTRTGIAGRQEGRLAGGVAGGQGGGMGGFGGAARMTADNAAVQADFAAKVAGIRPVRVEVPRTGQRFLFTKVLNIRDDKLALSAWAISTKARNALRAGTQAAAFLVGAFLLVWQARRTTPNSLIAAAGLALALGSFAAALLAARWLGEALIGLVPLLVLAIVVWLVRWAWTHRLVRRPAVAPDGVSAANGVAPVVTALMFLWLGASADAAPADRAARPAHQPVPTPPAAISSAAYTGKVAGRVARVEATFQIIGGQAKETIPLFGEEVAVESFSATPPETRLVRTGTQAALRLAKKGDATAKATFLVKLAGEPGAVTRQLGFAIPPALSSQVSLTLDEAEANVEFPTAVSFHSVTQGHQTTVTAMIGSGERVELRWSPRVKRAAEIAATVFCRQAALVSVRGSAVSTRSLLEYQITQGELREARVRLPLGQRLLRVEGEQLRTWQLKEEAGAQVLTAELLKGVTSGYRLTIETERALEALPGNFTVETPRALEVKRETGWVGLAAGEDIGLSVETAQGAQQVDVAEFLKVVPQAGALFGAYQFLKPDYTLRVRAEALQPELEAVVRNQLRIGSELLTLNTKLDYTIKRAGVFSLRLLLPGGFRLESVQGAEVAQWTEKTAEDRRVLEVSLKKRLLGACSLQLTLAQTHRELPKSLAVVGVHPLDTRKLNGYLVVASELGIQTKAEASNGLTEVPMAVATEAPSSQAAPPDQAKASATPPVGLAYKYILSDPVPAGFPWQLTVANEAVEAWVRAEVMNWWTVTETLASGRAVVRFEVQNAPVKEFRVRVPANARNVEVTGANIRRRDQATNDWRVELQNRVTGVYTLNVTWEMAASISEKESLLSMSGVTALGVERETGAVGVNAQAPLQVTEKTASAELVRIDPSELPAWAGAASQATVMACRYLRPGYQLTLAAVQHKQAEVLQALVDEARLTTVVAEDGQMMTELSMTVRNNGRQFLEVALPKGAQVWSAFVADEAVRPTRRAGKWLLPLERSEASESAFLVTLTYVNADRFPARQGQVELMSPGVDVPIKAANWDLYVPADYHYSRFEGTLTPLERGAAPILASFTTTAYEEVEVAKMARRYGAVAGSLSQVRGELSKGNVKDAMLGYNKARKKVAVGKQKEELAKLGDEINRVQASNFLNSQLQVMERNNEFLGQQFDTRGAQEQVAQLSNYDTHAVAQQLEKLQQAQEVAVAKVRPLRVNLPTSGLRYAFSQTLQTELGKPMQLRFLAASTKEANWWLRGVMTAVGFGLLWALMAAALRRKAECAGSSGNVSML